MTPSEVVAALKTRDEVEMWREMINNNIKLNERLLEEWKKLDEF